jgi:hypothetical protein
MFDANRAPILHQHQQRLQTDQNEIPHDPRHLGVPSSVSKTISKPMGHSTQTVHISCVKISSISKRTKTSVLLSLLSDQDLRVHPKQFMSLWYVWRKPYTYVAMTLTPSPNGPKRDSRWPTSPRSSIGCVKNDFWAYGTFGANHAPILRPNRPKWDSTW